MININSLSMYSIQMYSSAKKYPLTEQTIAKLLSLGIDINTVSSEEEAKNLIEEEENKRNSSDKTVGTAENNLSSEENILNRLKNLAAKLGILVSKDEKPEVIINKIEEKIKEIKNSASNPNINAIISEFETLKLQFKNMNNSTSFLNAMDAFSGANRAALGL